MVLFAAKRLLLTVPVLFVAVSLLFAMARATHSSPLRHAPPLGLEAAYGNANLRYKSADWKPPAITRNMERKFGIDKPWYVQYFRYLGGVARLDFGPTFTFQYQTVNQIIREQGPVTLELVALAFGFALVLGIPLALAAAARSGSLVDRLVTTLAATSLGLPSFFVATVLLWFLSVKVALVPPLGWDGVRAKILPSLVLSLVPMGLITRVLRTELLETRGREYVLAARAKGLRRSVVTLRHVLRPALIPIVSMMGPLLGQLVTGMFVVEWLFAIPGIGRYFIAAAQVGDYPLTLGLTVVLTAAIVLVNLAADLTLAVLDPRTRAA